MSHERRLLIEKIQVYSAAALCVFLMYMLLWPQIRPAGVDRVAAFLAEGAAGGLVEAIGAYWVFCVVAALLTAFGRPQGAMMAALAGLAAAGMHSEPTRLLINSHEGALKPLGASLLVELLILAAAVWLGTVLVRRLWLRIVAWRVPPERLGEPSRLWLWTGMTAPADEPAPKPVEAAVEVVKVAVVIAAVAGLLVQLLLNHSVSPERGQVIFVVFLAFWLASLGASWSGFFRDSDAAALAATVLVAVVAIAMTMAQPSTPPLTWMKLKPWAMALPVDWVAAGGCGALYGRWLALRLTETGRVARRVELGPAGGPQEFIDPQLIVEVFREPRDGDDAKAKAGAGVKKS